MNKSTVAVFNALWAVTCLATIYSVYQTKENRDIARRQAHNTARVATQLEIMNYTLKDK